MKIEHKSVPVSGFKVLDAEEGIVETIVSVTGIEDEVGDIIEPGAYQKTLAKRTPKGVRSHDWTEPVSKTLEARELMPLDPSLPKTLANGDPWPPEAGALYIKTQYNLATQRGREAFADVEFFGEDQEWSVGYNVPAGKARIDTKSGVRRIKEMDLYEYSDVLFGAMPNARTVTGVKDAQLQHLAFKTLVPEGADEEKAAAAVREVAAELDAEGVSDPDEFHAQFETRMRDRLGVAQPDSALQGDVEATDDATPDENTPVEHVPNEPAEVEAAPGEVDGDAADDLTDQTSDDGGDDGEKSLAEALAAELAGKDLGDVNVEELVAGAFKRHREAAEAKAYVQLSGSYEDRIDRLRSAIRDARSDDTSSGYVDIEATFDSRVIVQTWDGGERTMLEYSYVENADGDFTLGTPREVEVRGVVVGKSLGGFEAKAGRVLSQTNLSKLKKAISELQAILSAADGGKDAGDDTDTKDADATGEADGDGPETKDVETPPASEVLPVDDVELMLMEQEHAKALLDS